MIASDVEKGGTWTGATEALKAGWVPVFAVSGPDSPEGNRMLIEKGALPFPDPFPDSPSSLAEWLASNSSHAQARPSDKATQYSLF